MNNPSERFIKPIIDRNQQIEEYKTLNPEERSKMVIAQFGLSHGKGIRKKNYKK